MKIHITALVTSVCVYSVSCFAQPPVATADAHKVYDSKLKDCRKAALDRKLSGDELRTFVASCLKEGRS